MIDQYFRTGFEYEEIIALLERFHGVEVTLHTLYRLLWWLVSAMKNFTLLLVLRKKIF